MLTIRPWMVGWVGLIRACDAAATCVWSAYSLRPSHFDCLCREGIQLTRMIGVRASVLVFYPEDARSNPPWGGQTVCPRATIDCDLVTQHNSGSSMRWRAHYGGQSGGGGTSGGQTLGGENNHTPFASPQQLDE